MSLIEADLRSLDKLLLALLAIAGARVLRNPPTCRRLPYIVIESAFPLNEFIRNLHREIRRYQQNASFHRFRDVQHTLVAAESEDGILARIDREDLSLVAHGHKVFERSIARLLGIRGRSDNGHTLRFKECV